MKNLLLVLGMLILFSSHKLAALEIVFDYRFDTLGFFADPVRRAAIETAVQAFAPVHYNAPAIIPGEGNTWSVAFTNPSSGVHTSVDNMTIAENHMVFYLIGAPLVGSELSEASVGSVSASGSEAWLNLIDERSGKGPGPWGGYITFDTSTNWSFSGGAPADGQVDFISVASHGITHLLGFSSDVEAFDQNVAGGAFVGPHVTALMGGPVPLSSDGSHFAQSTTFQGRMPAMLPFIAAGEIQRLTPLDYAVLADIGYEIAPGAIPEPSIGALGLLGLGILTLRRQRRTVSGKHPKERWPDVARR